jgi:hypothetical protein
MGLATPVEDGVQKSVNFRMVQLLFSGMLTRNLEVGCTDNFRGSDLRFSRRWVLPPSSGRSVAVQTSETLLNSHQSTRRYNPESCLQQRKARKLKQAVSQFGLDQPARLKAVFLRAILISPLYLWLWTFQVLTRGRIRRIKCVQDSTYCRLRVWGCFLTLHAGKHVRFVWLEVFTAASVKMAAFWVVAPCNLLEVYWRLWSLLSLCLTCWTFVLIIFIILSSDTGRERSRNAPVDWGSCLGCRGRVGEQLFAFCRLFDIRGSPWSCRCR